MGDEETIKVGMAVSTIVDTEITRAEWNAMTPKQRDEAVGVIAEAFDWSWGERNWHVAEF